VHSISPAGLELVFLPETKPLHTGLPRVWTQRGWAQCRNETGEPLFVYGARDDDDRSTFDTSLYLLPPGLFTPERWDCKGILIPQGKRGRQLLSTIDGPAALKYLDFRRFTITLKNAGTYRCAFNNGVFRAGVVNWPVPLISYGDLLRLPRGSRGTSR
jgi:hypothetical protein